MADVLKIYNAADVGPFEEALQNTTEQYYLDKIDMLKDAVSVPGISMTYELNKSMDIGKNLELNAPGGKCNMCREKEGQLDSCDCNGALKTGVYCIECKEASKAVTDCKCDPIATYNLLKAGMVGGPSQVFPEEVANARRQADNDPSKN